MRLLIDSESPETIRGSVSLPSRAEWHSFSDSQGLLDLLDEMARRSPNNLPQDKEEKEGEDLQ